MDLIRSWFRYLFLRCGACGKRFCVVWAVGVTEPLERQTPGWQIMHRANRPW